MIDNPVPHRTYREHADYVISAIESMGICIWEHSRLRKMADVFVNEDGTVRRKIRASDPDVEIAIEAGRDLQQLAFILDTIPPSALVPFLPELIKVVGDQALPQHDRENSAGRDSQFHLYVAAIAQNAGFRDIRNAEPDVVCTLGDDELGIAAKRVKNLKQLMRRIRKASSQIANCQRPGLIAVETSIAFNRDNLRVREQIPEAVFIEQYRAFFAQFVRRHHDRFAELIDPWWVCGIIFHDQQVRLVDNSWEVAGLTFGVPFPARCLAHPERFWNVYERGLPNRQTSPLILPRRQLYLPTTTV